MVVQQTIGLLPLIRLCCLRVQMISQQTRVRVTTLTSLRILPYTFLIWTLTLKESPHLPTVVFLLSLGEMWGMSGYHNHPSKLRVCTNACNVALVTHLGFYTCAPSCDVPGGSLVPQRMYKYDQVECARRQRQPWRCALCWSKSARTRTLFSRKEKMFQLCTKPLSLSNDDSLNICSHSVSRVTPLPLSLSPPSQGCEIFWTLKWGTSVMEYVTLQKLVVRILWWSQVAAYQCISKTILCR